MVGLNGEPPALAERLARRSDPVNFNAGGGYRRCIAERSQRHDDNQCGSVQDGGDLRFDRPLPFRQVCRWDDVAFTDSGRKTYSTVTRRNVSADPIGEQGVLLEKGAIN